jgi:hypothetical protein
MYCRNRLRALTIGTIVPILLLVVGTTSCAPPAGLQADDATTQSDQHAVPFHSGDASPSAATSGDSAVHGNDGKLEANVPFHHAQSSDSQNLASQDIPAGTLLTVRLKSSIATGKPNGAASFDAVVDQAVVVEGDRLIPLGTLVSGLVESARASDLKLDRGYLRLTLASIHLAGSDVPIQTSSLFVRANAQTQTSQIQVPSDGLSSRIIRLESGRRLVFRLTKAASVASSQRLPAGF